MAKNGNGSWIARCKAYMKQHGCQLGEAMKALSNKNKGKGKSFRGGNTGGVAHNAEAFEGQGAPADTSTHPPPSPPPAPAVKAGGNALEHLGSMFEVGGTPNTTKVMDGGRRRRTQKKRGGRKAKKSGSRSRSRSRSRRHRHRSRRGGSGNGSSLSFSEYK